MKKIATKKNKNNIEKDKKEMTFILNRWVKYYIKEMARALRMVIIASILILAVVMIKYKPAYQVDLAGTTLGYIENKERLEIKIKDFLESTTGNIAFREQTSSPEYELKLVSRNKALADTNILMAIEDSCKTTYRMYAITVDGNAQTTVSTEEEAKSIVEQMKAGVDESVDLNVAIIEQYTTDYKVQNQEEALGVLNTVKVAKVAEYEAQQAEKKRLEEEEARKQIIAQKTVESVGRIAGNSLNKPLTGGSISSRFGSRSAIRSSSHTGLDIATPSGTPVTPIAPGTVKFADYKGSYGNLVIVDHGNGIESYYAHCSEIYCEEEQIVDVATVISAVGSTGNSTGPHLHLEIRQNGTPLNPEDYLY